VHTINYGSRRGELWRWYWRAWARPRGLWRFHVLFGLTFGIIITGFHEHGGFGWGYFLTAAAVGFLTCVALLPLWPQIRFKRAMRSLTINPAGIDTTVGTISGSKLWRDVRSIEQIGGSIIITGNNKNAFIIPARAFGNDRKRQEFYETARQWHTQAIA
jgi:hypothetical protein